MRRQFGKTIVKLAEKDERIVLIIGDVEQEMKEFMEKFPNRFYNLGICEQSMISIAAGMALEGLRPIVYSITSFFSKAFIVISVLLENPRGFMTVSEIVYFPGF